jgi:peptidoglycan/xylan/chitin deacetylase (PgdA/CDA1 family)
MRSVALAISLAAALTAMPAAQRPAPPARTMAVTIDDLPYVNHAVDPYVMAARKATTAILAALKAHDAPAVGFVNENQLEAATADERTARIALLNAWLAGGHVLGNHTYSHPDANTLSVDAYVAEIERGERVTRALTASATRRYFRHPMTHTGDTPEKKAGIAAALAARGYTIAPHTIENGDYLFDAAWTSADAATRARLRETYLEHTLAATAFAERKASELFGRDDVPQVLLIHTNALNGALLDALLARLHSRGYRFISLDVAMADPAYATPDVYVGRWGPTWLFRWSRTLAPTSDFRADPELPAWVTTLAEAANRR